MGQIPTLSHYGFFVTRRPALGPHEWSDYITASRMGRDSPDPYLLAATDCLEQRGLAAFALFQRQDVSEAIYLASPGFFSRLCDWRGDAVTKGGRKTLLAFERYFNRMCFRSTPFGSFASVGYGSLLNSTRSRASQESGEPTKLRRHLRIDFDRLEKIWLRATNTDCGQTGLTANCSAYRTGKQLRYADMQFGANNERFYTLAEIDLHPWIDAILQACTGVFITSDELVRDLAHRLMLNDEEQGQAWDLIDDLIKAKVLFSSNVLDPLAPDPALALATTLTASETHRVFGMRLNDIANALNSRQDYDPVPISVYQQFATEIDSIAQHKKGAAIQVDCFHSAQVLASEQVDETLRAVEQLICRFGERDRPLDQFCEVFTRIHGLAKVSLLQILEEGYGLPWLQIGSPDSLPAKAGIHRAIAPMNESEPPLSGLDRLLLRKLTELSLHSREGKITLTDEDLDAIPVHPEHRLSRGMFLILEVLNRPLSSSDVGKVLVHGISSRGAETWLSRFAYGDSQIKEALSALVKQEPPNDDSVLHAEIAFLPLGRLGNILTRPHVWPYRINVVEPSGGSLQHDLPLSDLLVSVWKSEVTLWSRSLGRRIIPHMTSAHNEFHHGNSDAYRFLRAVEKHGRWMPHTRWGPALQRLPYLPRVQYRNLILSPATWRVARPGAELGVDARSLKDPDSLLDFLVRNGVSRVAQVKDGDNTLVLDLGDPMSRQQLWTTFRSRGQLQVREAVGNFSTDTETAAGFFSRPHEIVLPVIGQPKQDQANGTDLLADSDPETGRAMEEHLHLAPLEEVLFVKIFTVRDSGDQLLKESIAELIRRQSATGAICKWFFIRYSDPDPHIRLRLFAVPGSAAGVFLDTTRALESLRRSRRVSRFEFCQYEREVVRYGGMEAIAHSEMLFWHDSEIALAILASANFSGVADRLKLAILCVDSLMRDFGYALQERLMLVRDLAASYRREFGVRDRQLTALGRMYRAERTELVSLLGGKGSPPWAQDAMAALARHSPARRSIATDIRSIVGEANARRLMGITQSHVHMTCVRLFESKVREHEVIVYDFLSRAYRSLLAQSGNNASGARSSLNEQEEGCQA
jgi:lantibiotic biosynthesis protein